MAVAPEPCMFCGETHRGNCGGTKKKVVARATKPTATPQPPTAEQQHKPSKLDRMRQAATETWQPTVEEVPRTRAQRVKAAAEPAKPLQVDRKFHTALDPDAVVLNGAIRTLANAGMLAEKELETWAAVLSVEPTLEEELMLWREQHKAAIDREGGIP